LGDSQLLSEISDQSVYALHGNMASASQSAGLLDQALAHVRRMLELEERVELSQQDRADGYRMAAGVFEAKGDLAAAEKYERQAYELSLGRLGAEDRRTLVSQNNLALIQKNRGDFAGSAATLTEVVDAQKRALGADHADVGASLFNLAESLLHQGQVQTALEHYRESNRIMELHFPGSARLAVNYVIYGRALGKAGEEEAAEFEFDRGLALAPGGDPLHPLTARLRVEHAAFLNDLGRSAEALPQLVEPTAKILETYGDTSREYALALLQRGRALVRGGDQERGRAALTRSREILESSPHRGRYRAEIEQARGLLAQ
ncbi:MAG: tetratricopeptide repeat protein, partial [Myxococcota bacterium]